MCCRIEVEPLVPGIAISILTLGQFHYDGGLWLRELKEEGTSVSATLDEAEERLRLSISPAVSIYAHHALKRHAAGVYFEIACKYAEKVNGRIVQTANVMGCNDGGSARFLAEYPRQPMDFSRVCNGFRETFLGAAV